MTFPTTPVPVVVSSSIVVVGAGVVAGMLSGGTVAGSVAGGAVDAPGAVPAPTVPPLVLVAEVVAVVMIDGLVASLPLMATGKPPLPQPPIANVTTIAAAPAADPRQT